MVHKLGPADCNQRSAVDLRPRFNPKGEREDFLQAEVNRLSSKNAELTAQAKNEVKAVRYMDTLTAEVQALTDKLRQSVVEKNIMEQKAAQEERGAKEAYEKRDAAMRAHAAVKLEAERASALADKLTLQVKELQQQLSQDWLQRTVLQRQIETYSEEIKQMKELQDMLDEERACRQKFEYQAAEQQNLIGGLREEFHARLLGDNERIAALGECTRLGTPPRQLTDDESIDAFGEVLKKLVVGKSAVDAQRVKRQLLFCFHPDKCPATEAATRITQILNSVTLVRGASPTPDRMPQKTTQAPTPSRSPMRPARQETRPGCQPSARRTHCHMPSDRAQSARPRCRC